MSGLRPLALLLLASASVAWADAGAACARVTIEQALLETNLARARGARCHADGAWAAAGALVWSPVLETAARRQAQSLADRGALSHTGPQGQTLAQRTADSGYRHGRVTENLAWGQPNLASVLRAWAGSETHCQNLVDPGVTEMALACVPARDGRPVWVMLKARPR